MRIVIPAAGTGTRMRPHTFTVPKALVPVAGKPMIDHILDLLRTLEPTEVALVTGYLGDRLVAHLREDDSLPFRFYHQEERKGLGHAVWQVLRAGDPDETLIVLGDSILELDYTAVVRSPEALIGVKGVDDPQRFGIVELEGDRIRRLVEKPEHPESNLAIAGLYYFPSDKGLREALQRLIDEEIRTRGEYQLTDALQILIDNGEPMRPFPIEGWYDCGRPETLLETQRHLLRSGRDRTRTVEGSVIRPPVHLSDEAIIESSIIGPDVTVEKGAVIRDSIVSDSIVCRGAEVTGCRIAQSIVGIDAVVRGRATRINIGQNAEYQE
jgi:glucose-1-phosphate thymidylyltransferase